MKHLQTFTDRVGRWHFHLNPERVIFKKKDVVEWIIQYIPSSNIIKRQLKPSKKHKQNGHLKHCIPVTSDMKQTQWKCFLSDEGEIIPIRLMWNMCRSNHSRFDNLQRTRSAMQVLILIGEFLTAAFVRNLHCKAVIPDYILYPNVLASSSATGPYAIISPPGLGWWHYWSLSKAVLPWNIRVSISENLQHFLQVFYHRSSSSYVCHTSWIVVSLESDRSMIKKRWCQNLQIRIYSQSTSPTWCKNVA